MLSITPVARLRLSPGGSAQTSGVLRCGTSEWVHTLSFATGCTWPASSRPSRNFPKGSGRPTGNGIPGKGSFFTSKAVDIFRLTSSGVRWTVDNLRHDTALGVVPESDGTSVVCQVDPQTDRSLAGIFREFSHDHAFVRTRPVVKLFEIGTTFVSRSEARRLLDGLEAEFETVEVDFAGVTDVGQGFVDELLRVWPAAHPGAMDIPINMNAAVEFMVKRW